MVYIWSEFAQKFRKFRNNPSSADVYQMVVFVESIAGLRPYEIVAAPGKPMKMQRSRVGFTMTMLHIMIFVMCSTYEFIYRPPTLSISNDPLNIYEEQILEYLQYINTIVFFVQIFVYRNRDLQLVPLNQRISRHLERIAVTDQKKFARQLATVTIVAFFTMVTMTALMFASKMSLLIHGLRGMSVWRIIVFSIASVWPLLYTELMGVQFCLTVYVMRMQTIKLRQVLEVVCRAETKTAPYELGQY